MQFRPARDDLATTAAAKRAVTVVVGAGAVAVAAVPATATAVAVTTAATAGCTFLRGDYAAGIKIGHGAKADTTKEITRVAAHNKCLPFQIRKDSFRTILCRNGAKGAALLQIL